MLEREACFLEACVREICFLEICGVAVAAVAGGAAKKIDQLNDFIARFSAGTRSMRSPACAETEASAKAAMRINLRT